MKRLVIIIVLSYSWFLTGCRSEQVAVKYDNVIDDIELANGKVAVEISPVRARIMGYRLIGKNNILWGGIIWHPHDVGLSRLRWNNYGGSRVWVLPQGITQRMVLNRHDPPDAHADGLPWTVLHRDKYRVVMQSSVSPETGLQLKREIILSRNDSTVTINDTMTRKLDIDCPVHLWRITQTMPAKYMLMDLKDNPCWKYRLLLGRRNLTKTNKVHELDSGNVLKIDWPDSGCPKVGSYGDWIAAVYKDQVFIQYGKYFPKGFYIDGANSEIYIDPEANMLEVESLSPLKMLCPGESLKSTTVWKLLPIDSKNSTENIIRMIDAGH